MRSEKAEQMVRGARVIGKDKSLSKAKAPQDKNVLLGQIAATDRQIDRLVYELYELTPEEIAIVEKFGQQGKEKEPAEV